jgi:enoyl-[acyl-carrier protein] reductase I
MGPVKAALESVTRYVAAELGPKGISVHALSPGPLATRAASGIDHFDELLNEAAERAPTNQLATIEDVGAYAAFLASAEAANVTGGIHMIDGGYHIIG